jgi:predicted acyltransferase
MTSGLSCTSLSFVCWFFFVVGLTIVGSSGQPYNKEEPTWPALQQRRTNIAIPKTTK